jgi:bacterial/archaeal transporter family-2 protein
MHISSDVLIYMLLGVIGGICVSLEGSLNSLLGRHVGVLQATIAPFGVGLIVILAVVYLFAPGKFGSFSQWADAPWYSYLGGFAAAVFVSIIIFIAPKVGIAAAFSAIIVGQLGMSLAADAFGLFSLAKTPISWPRIIGLIFLIVGMQLFFLKPSEQ